MSRLMVKNLPAYVTPVQLRQHFEQKGCPPGTLTDVQVAFKPDGTSRRFGFVGYKTDEEASAAKNWFDKTFIDSTRIHVTPVDVCHSSVGSHRVLTLRMQGFKDGPGRPNKRPRLGPSPTDVEAKFNKKPKSEQTILKGKFSAQVEEFLSVMQQRTQKGPSWANEPRVEQPVPPTENGDQPLMNSTTLSDLEWMKQRMSQNIDRADKIFEQSDEEDESPKKKDDTEVCTYRKFPL